MQRLHDKVNIIPVIAKADTLTPEEIQQFKKQILNEIAQHKIKIYDFPEPVDDEDEAKALRTLRTRVPYAVVGANAVVEIDGRKVRGRKYPWGVAEGKSIVDSWMLMFVFIFNQCLTSWEPWALRFHRSS